MEIRKVSPTDDVDALSRIYALSWKAAYQGIIPWKYLENLPENRWSATLKTSDWDSLVMLDEGEAIGTASICPARESAMEGWGELISIYLLPGHWGMGKGQLLLHNALEELRKQGYEKVYLWVLAKNARAIAFYEKNGFVATQDQLVMEIGGKELVDVRYVRNL